MLIQEPARTPYDLEGVVFGIPWRIHWSFWPLTAILGIQLVSFPGGTFSLKLQVMVIWILCVLVSITIHELGHVWAGMWFGQRGRIVLYWFGGLAVGCSDVSDRWQRISVSLAGPGAQFVLYGIIRAATWRVGEDVLPPLASEALFLLLWINLVWALLNLLPVFPLDGGQVSMELWSWFKPSQGLRYALIMSIITAVALAINSVAESFGHPILPWINTGGSYTTILFLCLAATNYIALRRAGSMGYYHEEARAPWEQDPDYWKK